MAVSPKPCSLLTQQGLVSPRETTIQVPRTLAQEEVTTGVDRHAALNAESAMEDAAVAGQAVRTIRAECRRNTACHHHRAR